MKKKLSEFEFDLLESEFDGINRNIEILIKSKQDLFKKFGISPQGFYYRKRKKSAFNPKI